MHVDKVDAAVVGDSTTVIARYLREGDELIRCAAAKALGALGDQKAASALVQALLDQDPDVRTDAMEALVRCARPHDAEAIRRSLEGDPVKEVKVFAIEALARLGDRAAIPLLRALAKSRTEDDVAWEDESGMWDDWLDVQVAAIKALGRMQASEAIDDLLDARTDEMGQELDIVVFAALAEIEDGGLSALFGLLRDRDPRVRERVLCALSKARPEAMLPMQSILLDDANPAIRQLAIGTLTPDSQAAVDLVLQDPDVGVRKAALAAFASARPDLVLAALRDQDEQVLAMAIQSLPTKIDAAETRDLAANLQAWMTTASTPLAVAATQALSRVVDSQAGEALCRLASDNARPYDVRIAALKTLLAWPSETAIKALQARVEDPIRQIRTTALAALATIARRQNDPHQNEAVVTLAAAIRGDLGSDVKVAKDDERADAERVGASKVEDGPGRITISPDGDIVTLDEWAKDSGSADDNVIEGPFPTSTLGAIQAPSMVPTLDDKIDPQTFGGQRGRRRRVAVDGPDDIGQDIRVIALGMIADCKSPLIDQALFDALHSEDQAIRLAAFKALAQRSRTGLTSSAVIKACKDALADADAAVRTAAATFIGENAEDAPDLLSALVTDPDAVVRTTALKAVAKAYPENVLGGLSDPSALVRRTAMQLLFTSSDKAAMKRGVTICIVEERLDTLIEGCRQYPEIKSMLHTSISNSERTDRQLRITLEVLASVYGSRHL